MTDWSDLDIWWQQQIAEDPAYKAEVRPLFRELLDVAAGERLLDLGTGTGWVLGEMSERQALGIGVEMNSRLAWLAQQHGPTVIARLPSLAWCRNGTFDGVTAVLVLEHVADVGTLFEEAARVTKPDGTFTLVVNHPQITAPGSAPIVDPIDGEVYWRWGTYLQSGSTEETADDGHVTFQHRPFGVLLSLAAGAGWRLETLVERGLPPDLVGDDPLLALQLGLPRLLGVRWRRS